MHPTRQRAQFWLIGPLALGLSGFAGSAAADISTALDLCLDIEMSLEDRVEAFAEEGWQRSEDMSIADAALEHALLMSGMSPENPDSWAEAQGRSEVIAGNLRDGKGYDDVRLMVSGEHAVVVEPNRSGLATCLYVGPPSDLEPVAEVIDDQPLYHIGPRYTIRGMPPFSALIAYGLEPDALDDFPQTLSYGATFTAVLDRR